MLYPLSYGSTDFGRMLARLKERSNVLIRKEKQATELASGNLSSS